MHLLIIRNKQLPQFCDKLESNCDQTTDYRRCISDMRRIELLLIVCNFWIHVLILIDFFLHRTDRTSNNCFSRVEQFNYPSISRLIMINTWNQHRGTESVVINLNDLTTSNKMVINIGINLNWVIFKNKCCFPWVLLLYFVILYLNYYLF